MDLENNSVIGEVATTEAEVNTDVSTENSNVDNGEQGEVAAPATEEKRSTEEKPKQSQEDNALFAKIRREAEENARLKYEPQIAEFQEMKKELQEWGYEGTPKEIALALKAQKQGLSIDEVLQQDEVAEKQRLAMLENAPEIVEARQATEKAQKIIFERQFETDLATIKAKFPECQAKTIEEIGETYMSLMATAESSGKPLNPIVAYIAQMENDKLNTKPIPPSMGSASSTDTKMEKEFYTQLEVDDIQKNQKHLLNNPKIIDKIFRSQVRW